VSISRGTVTERIPVAAVDSDIADSFERWRSATGRVAERLRNERWSSRLGQCVWCLATRWKSANTKRRRY